MAKIREQIPIHKKWLTVNSSRPFKIANNYGDSIEKLAGLWQINCYKLLPEQYQKQYPIFELYIEYDDSLVGHTIWSQTDIELDSVTTQSSNIDYTEELNDITGSVSSIDTSVQAVDTSVQAVDTSVQAVDTSVQAVDVSIQSVDTSINDVKNLVDITHISILDFQSIVRNFQDNILNRKYLEQVFYDGHNYYSKNAYSLVNLYNVFKNNDYPFCKKDENNIYLSTLLKGFMRVYNRNAVGSYQEIDFNNKTVSDGHTVTKLLKVALRLSANNNVASITIVSVDDTTNTISTEQLSSEQNDVNILIYL